MSGELKKFTGHLSGESSEDFSMSVMGPKICFNVKHNSTRATCIQCTCIHCKCTKGIEPPVEKQIVRHKIKHFDYKHIHVLLENLFHSTVPPSLVLCPLNYLALIRRIAGITLLQLTNSRGQNGRYLC